MPFEIKRKGKIFSAEEEKLHIFVFLPVSIINYFLHISGYGVNERCKPLCFQC